MTGCCRLASRVGSTWFQHTYPHTSISHFTSFILHLASSQTAPEQPRDVLEASHHAASMASNGGAVAPSSPDAGPSQSPRPSTSERSPRSSLDADADDATPQEKIARLEDELATTRQEKEVLGNQYRSLLGKLTAMRTSLGDKLREDAASRPVYAKVKVADDRKSWTVVRRR